jgi:hypothetical protein
MITSTRQPGTTRQPAVTQARRQFRPATRCALRLPHPPRPALRGLTAVAAAICAAALVSACSATASAPGVAAASPRPRPSAPVAAAAPTAAGGDVSTKPLSATAPAGTVHLTGISVGRHPAFDRIVFRFNGGIPGYRIQYTDQVLNDARGDQVPLPGRTFLRIVFFGASGYQSYRGPHVISPDYPTLLQLRTAGDFEGYLSFGAGLSSRAGFHVRTLTQPDRVVVDVAHRALPRFPGIWDITSWQQFWSAQMAFNEGHQPWLSSPLMVVQAWASGRWAMEPTIRQTAPNTFAVTEPGTKKVVTISGTRPATVGTAQLWVITRISSS